MTRNGLHFILYQYVSARFFTFRLSAQIHSRSHTYSYEEVSKDSGMQLIKWQLISITTQFPVVHSVSMIHDPDSEWLAYSGKGVNLLEKLQQIRALHRFRVLKQCYGRFLLNISPSIKLVNIFHRCTFTFAIVSRRFAECQLVALE